MKKFLLGFLVFFYTTASAQTIDHILFDYDTAGNQIKRYVIDITAGKGSNQVLKKVAELTSDDLISTDLYPDVKYYPNPVKEELYVQWKSMDNNFVSSAELYSLTGQLLKTFPALSKYSNLTVGFDSFPDGFYNLVLLYTNGDIKTLKIVKN